MSKYIYILPIFIFLCLNSCSYYIQYEDEFIPQIEENSKYIQLGVTNDATHGVIFYPGALVDPYAYLALLEDMAAKNVVIIIAKFPSNLAVLDINASSWLMSLHENVDSWTIIGHSLGGAMACSYVANHLDAFDNVILLGSYPGESTNLKNYKGLFLSVYGTKDAFTTLEDIEKSKNRVNNPLPFPQDFNIEYSGVSYFYEIKGGNHSYFGTYGMQQGDNEANITRDEQITIVKNLLNTVIAP